MEQKTIDKLVERLGMASALAPLLNSGNGYERFENALNNSLNQSLNTMPKIEVKKTRYSVKQKSGLWKEVAQREIPYEIGGNWGYHHLDEDLGHILRLERKSDLGNLRKKLDEGDEEVNAILRKEEKVTPRGMTPQKYAEAVDMFRKYFGLGENPLSAKDIATKYEVAPGFVGFNVNFVAKYLKQRFSKDLWYGTI
ncbi:MAG: hypothetical protein AABX93_03820 [Nanoarchaeota archaeon]